MTVNRTQNSVPVQRVTDITDGTTNTLKSAGKAEKPFAKDVFESSQPTANGLCTNEIIPGMAVEKPPAKSSFMDYTDDSCD